MKRVSLAVVAAVAIVGVVACQDAVTSPESNNSDLTLRYGISNPPPPPIDTGARGSFSFADLRAPSAPKFLQPRYTIVQSLSPAPQRTILGTPRAPKLDAFQSPFGFNVPVTYLWNPTRSSGYLHFSNDPDGVNASSNGMIKNNHGKLSGKGTLQIQTDVGLLVIDLSSLDPSQSSLGCPVPDINAAPSNDGQVCFHLFFTHATLYFTDDGSEEGTAEMDPGCPPDNDACFD